MSSFDTSLNIYLIAVFSLAAVALVLSLGVVATAVVRSRRVRLSSHRSMRSSYGRLTLHH